MRASVRYSTTVPFGTLAAYGLAALCSAMGCWRAVFAAAGLFLTATALCWLRGMRVLAPPLPAAPARSAARAAARPLPHRLPAVLALICLAALASGMIRDGIQTWTPTYLHDIYGLDNTFAIVLTFTLPLVNLCGVYMGKWANDHIFHSEAVTAAAAFLAACALLAAPAVGVRLPLWACLALLGLCAALMLAVNTMLVTLVPLRLQNTGRISALSGLLNSATYAGSTAFRLRHGPAAGALRLACGAAGPLRRGAGSLSFVCGRGTWMETPARISLYPSPERVFSVFKHHKNSSAARTKSPKNVIIAYCQKRQRSKRKVRKKTGGGKAMHLCAAKCRPRGECLQKGGGDRARRHVSERCEASLGDNRAESAALSSQTPFFHLK